MWEIKLRYKILYLTDPDLLLNQKVPLTLGLNDQRLCMTQLYAMGNNQLMFVITHKCGTNDPGTRPSLSQRHDHVLGLVYT